MADMYLKVQYEGMADTHVPTKETFESKLNEKAGKTAASQSAAGLMSAADKTKLDGIATGANKYTLPAATSGALGGVKVPAKATSGLDLATDGTLKADAASLKTLIGNASSNANGLMSSADKIKLDSMSSSAGEPGGAATLDENGKIPTSQLPSYVDDVLEGYYYNNKFYTEAAHTTEITAESGKIYVDLVSNKTYRWSGSAYTVISETLALGITSSTAFAGDKGQAAYTHAVTNKGVVVSGFKKLTTNAEGHVTAQADVTASDITGALGYTPPQQDTTYSNASTTAAGLMSAADKSKLNDIAANANNYTLPTATSSVLGGVKVGSNITVSSGTISLTKANVTSALGYTPPQQNTTYSAFTSASSTAAGTSGLVPAPTAGSNSGQYFLKADGTWAVPDGLVTLSLVEF